MSLEDVIRLAAQMTVARMLERDDFQQRYRAGDADRPPRVPLSADAGVRLGGRARGRRARRDRPDVQSARRARAAARRRPGGAGGHRRCRCSRALDGVQKMSKSLGNHIGDRGAAGGDVRQDHVDLATTLMLRYYELLSRLDAESSERDRERERSHPMEAKKALARELVGRFHGAGRGRRGRAVLRASASSSGRQRARRPSRGQPDGRRRLDMPAAARTIGFAASTSEARRLVAQGAVRVDGERGRRRLPIPAGTDIAWSRSGGGGWRRSRSATAASR